MKQENPIIGIEICTDCYYYYHNGIDSFNEESIQHLNGYEKQHIINSFNKIYSWDNKQEFLYDKDSIIDFSKNPCDICESHLSGNRFKMGVDFRYIKILHKGTTKDPILNQEKYITDHSKENCQLVSVCCYEPRSTEKYKTYICSNCREHSGFECATCDDYTIDALRQDYEKSAEK